MRNEFLKPKLLIIDGVCDQTGSLFFFEAQKLIDFDIKRVYYITDVSKDQERGFHAHKELKQLIIAVGGEVKITLDDGENKQEFLLSKPNQALYLPAGFWRVLKFENKTTSCFVFASESYDEGDYIRNYEEFKKWALLNKKN